MPRNHPSGGTVIAIREIGTRDAVEWPANSNRQLGHAVYNPATDRAPILILGARSFAREVADLLSDLPGFELRGFVENLERERCANSIDGLPVHWIDDLASMA